MQHTKLLIALGALILVAGCATQPGGMSRPGGNNPPPQPSPSPTPSQTGQPGPTTPQSSGNGGGQTATTAPQQPKKAPPRSASEISSPAVMSLLGRADTLANAGHMDAAASTLERALDLDPRNPFIYQRLAAVRLAEGQNGQAEQMAMKSNSVSDNNPFVESGNWQLIAEARKQAGDKMGAQKASAQAVNFRQAASQYNQ
ncbi:tetratricopeptide repeat protein [Salinisphaera hydrothermalis]|uniref:TPR repeat-containing protein n=1 Tax=Salinisphaera hydrothermalis (strain C41B8) TaxID=1304275 RepID=A0A084IQC1_SALHC|nr:tetratricopeptide repeat protein [Salinisphaera hydrothermalis]KEZ78905.1 TPR repeat-containing protein [Salinisphaera hydrothermalis C41B8]